MKTELQDGVRYIAVVKNVTEVTLAAAADLDFWLEKLKPARLYPADRNGRAELSLSATRFRWLGVYTCEFTIGVAASQYPGTAEPDGIYLVSAFNSSALFAYIERTLFHTPYFSARIHLQAQLPALLDVHSSHGDPLLYLQMGAESAPLHEKNEMWQGKIFLPHNRSGDGYFNAFLGGVTHTLAFSPVADRMKITPHPAFATIKWLLESDLSPREWRLRTNAVHSRSQTFKR